MRNKPRDNQGKIIKVGDKVEAPNGYRDNGEAKPRITGTVEELYGPNLYPRVQFSDKPYGHLETVVPYCLTIIERKTKK